MISNWIPDEINDWSPIHDYATRLVFIPSKTFEILPKLHLFKKSYKVVLSIYSSFNDDDTLNTEQIGALLERVEIQEIGLNVTQNSPFSLSEQMQQMIRQHASKIKIYCRYVKGLKTLKIVQRSTEGGVGNTFFAKLENPQDAQAFDQVTIKQVLLTFSLQNYSFQINKSTQYLDIMGKSYLGVDFKSLKSLESLSVGSIKNIENSGLYHYMEPQTVQIDHFTLSNLPNRLKALDISRAKIPLTESQFGSLTLPKSTKYFWCHPFHLNLLIMSHWIMSDTLRFTSIVLSLNQTSAGITFPETQKLFS
ncbi:unnamed protein product [Ambrosiozyma monospora]|uniref:Unnamed protein product n=1 Tax=Ambrosiozyma monospora TaxID=43982 RepID=A0ACB5T060_AMBMO|nr:unnamed protein product [Ambrosiozyma monospora]